MIDRNVSVTFVLQLKEGEEPPEEYANFSGSLTFWFPASKVFRALDKDIRIISMSGDTRALDLFRQDDSVRIVGIWQDDPTGDYDQRKSLERQHMLYLLNSLVEVVGWFTWSSRDDRESLKCMLHQAHCDAGEGEGDLLNYNFLFAILEPDGEDDLPPWDTGDITPPWEDPVGGD
jgi:hypothetical protein